MGKPPRITLTTLKVLASMMRHGREQFSGSQVGKQSGLPSGTLYPILLRLEEAGWLESEWEAGEPSIMGRPRRRLYRVTALGAKQINELRSEVQTDFGGLSWA